MKYQTVPLYPLRPEWREHVESLFVTPNMVVINPRGVHLQHTTDRISRENEETKVHDIRSIFYSGETLFTDIYVVGDAGSGKSVLCEYIAHLWVKCHSTHAPNLDNDNFMENFTFLFYISLREAKSYDVEAMIRDQLDIKHSDISKLLWEHTSLVILDGLDEYLYSQTSIPARQHSAKSTYITTSRPWKIELLRKELEHKVKRQISIIGFESGEQDKLVKKVLYFLNSEKGQEKSANDFFKDVDKNKLRKHMETPVLLMQMLGLWFSGESFGRSQCDIYSKTVEMQLQFTEEIKGVSKDHHTQNVAFQTKAKSKLPDCFKHLRRCQKYQSLLLKLSKLAYQQLFSKDRSVTLIFDHGQMEISGMTEDEMRLCLQLGLLTQFKVIGEITQRLKYVSFVHKSHQEFFAAIYLSQTAHDSDLRQLFKGFTGLDRALEIEKVFTFVSGMNPRVSCKIAKAIMQYVKKDSRVQEYRGTCLYVRAPFEDLVKQIQGMILAAIEEGTNSDVRNSVLPLQDIWMQKDDREFPPSRIFECTKALDLSHVRSVFINDPADFSKEKIWRLVEASLTKLQKLVLFDCDISADRVHETVRQIRGNFQALGLYYTNVGYVDFSQTSHKNLQHILAAPKRSLGLGYIRLTHDQMGFMCQHLSTRSVTELCLANLECTDHGTSGNCQSLDLSSNKNILRIELTGLPLQNVVFHIKRLVWCVISSPPEAVAADVTRCLGQAEKLETLQCIGYRKTALNELRKMLHKLINLKTMSLVDADLSGHEQLLFTPNMTKLEHIYLYAISLTAEHFLSLLASLPSCRVRVRLGNNKKTKQVTITEDKTDVLQHIRDNPDIDVRKDYVERKGTACVVTEFEFYTKK